MRKRVLLSLQVLILFFASAGVTARAEVLDSVTDTERNFVATFTTDWDKEASPSKIIAFEIAKGTGRVILIVANESDVSTATLVKQVRDEDKTFKRDKPVTQDEVTVAGEKAVTISGEFSNSAFKGHRCVTVFTHQGIAYRIIGVTADNDLEFIQDYANFLARFKFFADRKEWLEKLEGKPAAVAMLGGLATFELNAPRWKENTFELKPDYNVLEMLSLKYMLNGAWVHVNAVHSDSDSAAEMERFAQDLSAMFKNLKPVGTTAAPQPGAPAVRTFQGEYANFKRSIRAAVLTNDGLAVHIWVEALESRQDEIEKDWQQLLRTLKLRPQHDATFQPAYAIRKEPNSYHEPSAPALEAMITAAPLVIPSPASDWVNSIAPDGRSYISAQGAEAALVDLSTQSQVSLKLTNINRAATAWSQDSKRLAWVAADTVHLYTIANATEQTIKARATEVSFAEDKDALFAAVETSQAPKPRYGTGSRFNTSHLEKLTPGDSKTAPHVVDFPFSRVRCAVVSPDKTQLALVTNRDCERTTAATHLYVCKIDGTDLKQLTTGKEDFTRVAWSTDGSSVYALGWLRDKDMQYPIQGSDIYRVPVNGGEPVNLTRCAKMRRVWFCGSDLFFEYNLAGADTHKLGIYRIALGELEKVTAKFEVPVRPDYKQVAADAGAAIKTLIGAGDPVLTPELMAAAAKVFAETAGPRLHEQFDYSAASLTALLNFLNGFPAPPADRMFILGAGAYYGETLRHVAKAEWKLKPLPYSQWLPGRTRDDNPLVRTVLPLSTIFQQLQNEEDATFETERTLEMRDHDQQLILAYPPADAEELANAATDPRYREALKQLDRGEIDAASKLLTELMTQHPQNHLLAEEVIAICDAAGRHEAATGLVRQAVDGGNQVASLLLRYADDVIAADPAKAQQLYFKASAVDWPPAEVYIKLGKLLASQKHPELAAACWRVAHPRATAAQKTELEALLKGETPPPESKTPNPEDDGDDD